MQVSEVVVSQISEADLLVASCKRSIGFVFRNIVNADWRRFLVKQSSVARKTGGPHLSAVR